MKKKNVYLSVESPCNQDYNKFKPTKQGGFCLSCSKEVLDFSEMSNHQILETLKKSKNTCGRFREDQLGYIGSEYDKSSNRSFSYISASLGLISLLSVSNLFSQTDLRGTTKNKVENKGKAEKKVIIKPSVKAVDALHKEKTFGDLLKQKIQLKGRVIDKNGEPLFGANVYLKNLNVGSVTDFDGLFNINVEEIVENEIALAVSYVGFKSKIIYIAKDSLNEQLDLKDITLETNAVIMGAIVGFVVQEKKWIPRWVWRKSTTPFRRLYYKVF